MKLSDLKEGDIVMMDDGFTCIEEGEIKIVYANDKGDLYVTCNDGRHYLDGQIGDDGELIGIMGVNVLIESIAIRLSATMPEMRDEPSAYKRAIIRMAIKAFIEETSS